MNDAAADAISLARRCVTASLSGDTDLVSSQLQEFLDKPEVLLGASIYLASWISGFAEAAEVDTQPLWSSIMLEKISSGEEV